MSISCFCIRSISALLRLSSCSIFCTITVKFGFLVFINFGLLLVAPTTLISCKIFNIWEMLQCANCFQFSRLTSCVDIGRQRLSLKPLPYLCHLQLHQSSLWLDSALFSVLSVSAKTAGHPLLNMEFWINMQLMVLAAETKTRFFSHTTKHFYSPWLLPFSICCLLMLSGSYLGNITLSHQRPCFPKWRT